METLGRKGNLVIEGGVKVGKGSGEKDDQEIADCISRGLGTIVNGFKKIKD